MTRAHIPLKTQLAAALCQMLRPNEHGKWERIIDHDHAKSMTPDQVISLFHLDHYPIRKEMGGPDEHWNLTHKPILEHRKKTAKVDRPQIAKSDRITEGQEAFRRKLFAKAGQDEPEPVRSEPRRSRPMPGTKASGLKKRMSGKVERRT